MWPKKNRPIHVLEWSNQSPDLKSINLWRDLINRGLNFPWRLGARLQERLGKIYVAAIWYFYKAPLKWTGNVNTHNQEVTPCTELHKNAAVCHQYSEEISKAEVKLNMFHINRLKTNCTFTSSCTSTIALKLLSLCLLRHLTWTVNSGILPVVRLKDLHTALYNLE